MNDNDHRTASAEDFGPEGNSSQPIPAETIDDPVSSSGWIEPHRHHAHEFLSHSEFISFATQLRDHERNRQLEDGQHKREWLRWSDQAFAKLIRFVEEDPFLFDEPAFDSSESLLAPAGAFRSTTFLQRQLSKLKKSTVQTSWKEYCSGIRSPLLRAFVIAKLLVPNDIEKCEDNSPLKTLDKLWKVLSEPYSSNCSDARLRDFPQLLIRQVFQGEEKWREFFETKEFKDRARKAFAEKICKAIDSFVKGNQSDSVAPFIDAVAEWTVRSWDNSHYSPIIFFPYNFLYFTDFCRENDAATDNSLAERYRSNFWHSSADFLPDEDWVDQLHRSVDKFERDYSINSLQRATHSLKRNAVCIAAVPQLYPAAFDRFTLSNCDSPIGRRNFCYSYSDYAQEYCTHHWHLNDRELDLVIRLLGDAPNDLPWILRSLK